MPTKSFSVPVAMLRQYCFCPRIVFFQEVQGLAPAEPPWVRQGVDAHRRVAMLEKRRGLRRLGLDAGERRFDVPLCSERLGLHGIADGVVIGDGWVAALEFKPEISRVRPAHWVQAVAYGMLAEEQFARPLRCVALLYGPRGQTAVCAGDLAAEKARAAATVAAVRRLLASPLPPPSDAAPDKCAQCEYFNFCNDRELRDRYF